MATPADDKKSADKPRASRPTQVVLTEADNRSLIDWTPGLIRSAELQADRGNLRMAADLVELMLTDDRVMGATEALTSVVTLPLKFDPEESPVSQALAGRQGDWWQMFPEPELKKLIKWGYVLGVGVGYIKGWIRDQESGRLLADLEVWHPRNLSYNSRLAKWFIQTNEGPVEVTAGDGRWILFSPYGKKRPWADAPWRGLSRWWLIKRYAQHDWASYSERQGNGTEVVEEEAAKGPEGLPLLGDETESQARREELVADLRRLKRNAKIALPPGFKYKLVESIAQTWRTFQAQKECADTAIAIAIVGQNLSTEIKGGSLAAASVHEKVEWRVIRGVAECVSTMARRQVLPWYCLYNFTNESAPWPVFDTAPPEDIKAKTEALKNFATFLKTTNEAGYDVENVDELALKYGIVLKKRVVPPPVPPKAPSSNEPAVP